MRYLVISRTISSIEIIYGKYQYYILSRKVAYQILTVMNKSNMEVGWHTPISNIWGDHQQATILIVCWLS